jgi:hypothetical protein
VNVFDTERATTTGSRSPPTAEVGMGPRLAETVGAFDGSIVSVGSTMISR